MSGFVFPGLNWDQRQTDLAQWKQRFIGSQSKQNSEENLFWKHLEGTNNNDPSMLRPVEVQVRIREDLVQSRSCSHTIDFWKALKLLDSDLDLHQCGVVTDYLLQFYIDMEAKLRITKLRVNHFARITIDITFFFNFFFFQFKICLKGIVYHYLILYLNTSLLSLHSLIEPHSTCCLAVKQISE